jgi:SIR2-like domain
MDFEDAIQEALGGQAVLFIGAGFTTGATNVAGGPFKSGPKLAQYLAAKWGLPSDTGLEDAADEFVRQKGRDELITELQQEFTVKEIALHHRQIAAIPWRRVYTTNYDNLPEIAYAQAGRRLTPITLGVDIRAIPKSGTLCVHLNGFVDRITRDGVMSELKLTDTSYVTASIASSAWSALLREDVQLARAVFFVGYSLFDLVIRRVLFETNDLHEKCFFVLGPTPEPATTRRVSRFGSLVSKGVDDFAAAIAEKQKHYVAPSPLTIPYACFERFHPTLANPAFSDSAVFDLLLKGDVQPDFVWNSLRGGTRYYLKRAAVEEVLEHFRHNTPAVIVHSELGNGKTLVTEGIKCEATRAGRPVFTLTRRTDNLLSELDRLLKDATPLLLVLDGYPDWFDAIDYFARHAPDNASLLLTARTPVHDVLVDRLADSLGVKEVTEISADLLTSDDLEWLVDFLDEYGLWAAKAAWSRSRKLRFLDRDCGAEFHAILLKLLESPDILARFSAIFDALNNKKDYYEVVATILILDVLGATPRLDILVNLWGDRILGRPAFRQDPTVRQLFDFGSGRVTLRSSVAGQFILKRLVDTNILIDVLIHLAREADKLAPISRYYSDLMRELMRFGRLQYLLPEAGRREGIVRYYESIKNLNTCRRQPLFWLQYAIACLTLNDLERADKYFDTAYSLAEDISGFDTYQIDNHYARFLLVTAIENENSTTCMQNFRRARRIVNEQIIKERLRYPYRVASMYGEFFDWFERRLTASEREEIGRAARFVAERIAKLPDDRQQEKQIVRCRSVMKRLMASVELKEQ